MVNYEESVAKPFTDIKNLVIGIILSLIPIVNITVVTGYFLEASGLGRSRPSRRLPAWEEYVELFKKGLVALAIAIVYMIPAVVVASVGIGLALSQMGQVLMSTVLTQDLMTQLQMGYVDNAQIQQVFSDTWYLMLPEILGLAPIFIVAFLLALLASYAIPVATLCYLSRKSIGSAFDFGAVLRRIMDGRYLTAWLIALVLSLIVGGIFSNSQILGKAAATFITGVISWNLYGQAFKEIR